MTSADERIRKAARRLKRADTAADEARAALRQLMREELAAGRTNKSEIARALGVSRQRVQKMLAD